VIQRVDVQADEFDTSIDEPLCSFDIDARGVRVIVTLTGYELWRFFGTGVAVSIRTTSRTSTRRTVLDSGVPTNENVGGTNEWGHGMPEWPHVDLGAPRSASSVARVNSSAR
jgi:hypothetical protein